jgi:hypothetical protein
LQIMRTGNTSKRLLGVLLSPEVMVAADLKPGDFTTLHFGVGADRGWLRLDLAAEASDSRVLSRLPGSPSATAKFTLLEPTLDATVSHQALAWEARPGTVFIAAPLELEGLFIRPRDATLTASGLVPLHHADNAERKEQPVAPAAAPEPMVVPEPAPEPVENPTPLVTPEQDLAPVVPELGAVVMEPPPLPPAIAERKAAMKENPDQLKPEAMQLFAAGKRGRAVADELGVSFSLVTRWQEEFDLARKVPAKRRAA